MSQTTTRRPRTANVIPCPEVRPNETNSTTSRASGIRKRIAHLFRRRHQEPQRSYRLRRVGVEPFERGSVDWQRMLMSMQCLN
jgi:hypothetical protein